MKVIIKLLLFLLIIGIIVCSIGVFLKDTDVGQDITDLFDPAFYVEYNGRKYQGTNNAINLPRGKEVRFNVSSLQGYRVAVTVNIPAGTYYTYSVDGLTCKLTSETSLTKAFLSSDNVHVDYFTLDVMDRTWLVDVLSKVYDGKSIDVINYNVGYLLTITSGNQTIQFQF